MGRAFRPFSDSPSLFDNEIMRNRHAAWASSRAALVLALLVVLIGFVVLHDTVATTENPAAHHGFVEDEVEYHSVAFCALLIVGTASTIAARRSAIIRRPGALAERRAAPPMRPASSRSSPRQVCSLFDFSPILA